ncbi:hypothetical protein ASF88_12270 [Leifsonia sp. Leaf336]|uniref:DUF7507 domain-containing protein n=1 Tax=Leifsonia sp. Leaf336 TaxID=1736341 RepID=UPI000700324C|nr:hypothetical protein [Leifsonia sp. Leaf336]KQR52318.1 hypothetical protein ASF88_12270 [Leifsonia sp. Leaf336]
MILSKLSTDTPTPTPAPNPAPAMSAELAPWLPTVALLVAMILAFIALLFYMARMTKKKKDADTSVVRAWIAVTLIAGLLILTAVTFGGTDSSLRNTLVGGIVAAAGTAVAFYFATKANEASNAAVLKAAGIDGGGASRASLALTQIAVPAISEPPSPTDVIVFHFKVTNNSNQTLRDVVLVDSLQPPTAITYVWPTPSQPGVLKGGESVSASTTYTIQDSDITAGAVKSRTVATGAPPAGAVITSAPETWTTALKPPPAGA